MRTLFISLLICMASMSHANQIEICAELVAFEKTTLDKIANENPNQPLDLQALSKLRKEHKATVLYSPRILTKSRQNTEIKQVEEVVYPTDFCIDLITNLNSMAAAVVSPAGFEKREVGMIFSASPVSDPDLTEIDLTIVANFSAPTTWHNFPAKYSDSKGNELSTDLQTPFFKSRQIVASIVIKNGQTVIMGGGMNEFNDKTTSFLFVTARIVNSEGKLVQNNDNDSDNVSRFQSKEDEQQPWIFDGKFYDLITKADRVVIRNGGFDCCGSVDKQKVLLTITNQQDIAKLNDCIQIQTNQDWNACMCCGYPGLDWYIGNTRIALTGVQHGRAIRWKDFPGDGFLTDDSSRNLSKWLFDHHIPDMHGEMKKIAEKNELPTKP